MIAVSALLTGFAAVAAVAAFASIAGVRVILVICLVMNVLVVVTLPMVDKTTKEDFVKMKKENEGGFTLKNVLILFRDPDQWLVWLAIGLGYTGYIGIAYLAPLMVDAFGMSEAVATALSTVTNHGVGIVAPLIAGALATRFGAVRSYLLWLAFSVKGRSAISSTVLTNIEMPVFLFGTSVGIESLIMTIPDTFCYTIAGNMIEANGTNGYYYVFGMCLAFAVAGLACCIIVDRRLKAGKTSAWFMEQHHHAKSEN